MTQQGELDSAALAYRFTQTFPTLATDWPTFPTAWQRKHLAEIGRFYPSSRLCGVCGAMNTTLRLLERVWTCACGMTHNRDLIAAQNIGHEGLRLLAEEYSQRTETPSACGSVARQAGTAR